MTNSRTKDYWHMFKYAPVRVTNNTGEVSDQEIIAAIKCKLILINDDNLTAWTQVKRKLTHAFPKLTESDLSLFEGREDELISRILRKTGSDRSNIELLLGIL